MRTITVNMPDETTWTDFDIKFIFAGILYEKGVLSSGQAAESVGITKRDFIENLGKYGFSWLGEYTVDDLEKDLQNVR